MRGRTNTNLYSGVSLNGVIENYEVAMGERVVAGDFVKIQPNLAKDVETGYNVQSLCLENGYFVVFNNSSFKIYSTNCVEIYSGALGTEVTSYVTSKITSSATKMNIEGLVRAIYFEGRLVFCFVTSYYLSNFASTTYIIILFSYDLHHCDFNQPVEKYFTHKGSLLSEAKEANSNIESIVVSSGVQAIIPLGRTYLQKGGEVVQFEAGLDIVFALRYDVPNPSYNAKADIVFGFNQVGDDSVVFYPGKVLLDTKDIKAEENYRAGSFTGFICYTEFIKSSYENGVSKSSYLLLVSDYDGTSALKYFFICEIVSGDGSGDERIAKVNIVSKFPTPFTPQFNQLTFPLARVDENRFFCIWKGNVYLVNVMLESVVKMDGEISALQATPSSSTNILDAIYKHNSLICVYSGGAYKKKGGDLNSSILLCYQVDWETNSLIKGDEVSFDGYYIFDSGSDFYIVGSAEDRRVVSCGNIISKFGEDGICVYMCHTKTSKTDFFTLFDFEGVKIKSISGDNVVKVSNDYYVNGVANEDGNSGDVIEVYVPYKSS